MGLIGEIDDLFLILKALVILVLIIIVLIIAYRLRDRILFLLFGTTEVKMGWQDCAWFFCSCGGLCAWNPCWKAIGQKAGISYRVVEVKNICIGNIGEDGDYYVSLDLGINPDFNTRTHPKSNGKFEKFHEIFQANLRTSDGLCVLKVMDQDILMHDEVGRVELEASEIFSLIDNGSEKQIYRFDLKLPDSSKRGKVKGGSSANRPYITLQMRDVTSECDSFNKTEFRTELLNSSDTQYFRIHPNDNEIHIEDDERFAASQNGLCV